MFLLCKGVRMLTRLSFQQVKNVKRKHRKACVLLIEGNTNDKKKG